MIIKIEIPDDEIKDRVLDVIAERYYGQFSEERRKVDRITSECVREIIYKDKEQIVDRIVSQASKHTKNLAVKKIIENIGDE